MMRPQRFFERAFAAALTIGVVAFAPLARAADSDPDRLFSEARALMDEDRFAEAIPKLEEAQRLDPGIGTQFNLAVAYAKTGRLAAAWRNFVDVETLARAAGKKPREEAARRWLDELRPHLSYARIRIDEPGEVTVRVDGEIVTRTQLDFVPLDPGEHRVTAQAAAKKPFEQIVTVAGDGERHEIAVLALEAIPTKTEVTTITRETTNTRRTLGFAFGGAGLAGLATAAVTGAMVLSAKATADERCKPDCITEAGELDREGVDAVQRGKTLLAVNLVAWGVAAVGLGVGAFFLVTSGRKDPPKTARVSVVPAIDPNGAYSVIRASF